MGTLEPPTFSWEAAMAQGLNPDSGYESPVLFSVWRLDGVGRYRPAPPPGWGQWLWGGVVLLG